MSRRAVQRQDVRMAMDNLRMALSMLRPLVQLARPWLSDRDHLDRALRFMQDAREPLKRALARHTGRRQT